MAFSPNTVIVAAGTPGQIEALENLLTSGAPPVPQGAALILGGGRVGLVAASYLEKRGHECVIVDKSEHLARAGISYVRGDAAELEILEQAGLRTAPSVLITTHDDDTNIYLTIYCRRLRPDIQIISRATYERNVDILHAAGADLVLSLASLITHTAINMLSPGQMAMLNEGLNLFRCAANGALAGKKLIESGIRDATNCSVVAVQSKNSGLRINPEPDYVFSAGDKFYLIGDSSGQAKCYELYGYEDNAGSNV
jgi:Trk K+ transport system NAD-binding subunit